MASKSLMQCASDRMNSVKETFSRTQTLAEITAKTKLGVRGQSQVNKGVNLAVTVLVVALMTAYLLPIAINELNAVDTSTWGDAEASLFGILGIFFVLAIVLYVVNMAME